MKRKTRHLYEQFETLSPIYGGRYTNHLPMMLTALQECAVTDEKIEVILREYKHKKGLYSLTDPSAPIGDFEQEWINQTSFFLGEINRFGIDIVIGKVLNKLTHALQSGLYHGLIRLAYAFRSKNEKMIAQALAYCELITNELDVDATKIESEKLGIAFRDLVEARYALEERISKEDDGDFLKRLINEPNIAHNIVVPTDILNVQKDMLEVFLHHYMDTLDFYTLHVITGFHALKILEEFFTDFKEVLMQYYKSAQLMMIQSTQTTRLATTNKQSFGELIDNIGELKDAHQIKLLFSLFELYNLFGLENCLIIAREISA